MIIDILDSERCYNDVFFCVYNALIFDFSIFSVEEMNLVDALNSSSSQEHKEKKIKEKLEYLRKTCSF